MPYRLPLHVNERMLGTIELVDADGRVIAAMETRSWHGVRLEQQPDFVRENFEALAAVANKPTGDLRSRPIIETDVCGAGRSGSDAKLDRVGR